MRMSQMFSQTLREAPADAEIESHKLLVRSGFIRQLGAGVYSLMPLAMRTTVKIENIIREEMNAIGGQEILMPVVNPAEVWKETNRYFEVGGEMSRFKDRKGADMVLAMTHEEVVTDLVRKFVQSYKQMPMLVYHIQTKWRDDARPRAGLIRVREFTMKDSYSLDVDDEGLDKQYRAHYQAYFNIFNRCNLPSVSVLADVGMMGGSMSHEYMYITPIGEDTLLNCSECGYLANRQIALFRKPEPEDEAQKELEKIATPDSKTIADLAKFLDIPESKTAKAIFLVATITEGTEDVEKLVFAITRGDMDLNETKLANAIKSKELRPAEESEIEAVGAVPGYASPIGIKDIILVVDDLAAKSPNLVAGANDAGFHYLNTNYGRDYEDAIITDIVAADDGYSCPDCGHAMHTTRGVEIGNIFKLGTRYSSAMKANFLDQNGKAKPVIMGSYGIGSGRLLQSIAEEYRDDYGLMWPISVAPYHVHLVALRGGEEQAEKLYEELQAAGVEVLYDDRKGSPGVKFNDSDLIGIPIRLTTSERSTTENSVEVKLRKEKDRHEVSYGDTIFHVKELMLKLEAEIQEKVIEMPFKA
ncbi:MAG: proline--tRNA ligase [Chloroflexi bacterium]|nr:proline--tRNA ligase [Chloroflexota bacterium]